MAIVFESIGIVRSPFKDLSGMPIQPSGAKGTAGTIEILPQYQEGLKDLDGFSHIILLYHFHKSEGFNLHVVPFLDKEERGLFATRAPKRPNQIGLSIVRVSGVDGCIVTVRDIDILDGTPLLDIKPYVQDFDVKDNVTSGWLESASASGINSDDRFL